MNINSLELTSVHYIFIFLIILSIILVTVVITKSTCTCNCPDLQKYDNKFAIE